MKSFRELFLGEMFGPMGGDQRNMKGSIHKSSSKKEPEYVIPWNKVNRKLRDESSNADLRAKHNISLGQSDKGLIIWGRESDVESYLKEFGINLDIEQYLK